MRNTGSWKRGPTEDQGLAGVGLLGPSIVTGIVRTIQQEIIISKIGELPVPELHLIEDKLPEVLAL
jgi:hypothetical protein